MTRVPERGAHGAIGTVAQAASPPRQQVELVISGMTCASCAARIEKKLNRLEGVSATVNYATGKARISYADPVSPEDLVHGGAYRLHRRTAPA